MISIVVLGAGRSAGYFIDYTIDLCKQRSWKLVIADLQTEHLQKYKKDYPGLELVNASLNEQNERLKIIDGADWVVSLLPAFMHPEVATDCLLKGCNLATASYVSEQMKALSEQAELEGLVFLNECGLDPGIDHMSAVKIINDLRDAGAEILGYQSYCGGLIAPEFNDNPWNYKFSWNPRNVVLAGNSASTSLQKGELKIIPYHQNFQHPVEINLPNGTSYEGYVNRDSLSYRPIYNLTNVKTMIRGTLRYPGFCRAWNLLIHLGLTDNSYVYPVYPEMTYREFFHSFLMGHDHSDISESIRKTIGMDDYEQNAIDKVLWTGLNGDELLPLDTDGTPAGILQSLLEKKWEIKKEDKDLVVMQHKIRYKLDNEIRNLTSSFELKGEGVLGTAMSKTVGLPLAITLKNLIDHPIDKKGLVIPIHKSIYEPVLQELEKFGILFKEETTVESKAVAEGEPE
ncbi:MAG: saccharopine dehydrogenase family protein [Bacteroidia bacterium]